VTAQLDDGIGDTFVWTVLRTRNTCVISLICDEQYEGIANTIVQLFYFKVFGLMVDVRDAYW